MGWYPNFLPGISIFFRVFIHNINDIQTHQTNAEYLFLSHILPAERNPELWTWEERSHRHTTPMIFLSEWMGEVNTDTKCDGFCRVCPKVPARTEWKARWFPKFTECRSEFLPLMFLCCNACSCLQTYFMPRTYRLFGYSSLSFINIQVLLYFRQFPACW